MGNWTVQRVMVEGKPMIALREKDFEFLLRKADFGEPDLPLPDAKGNYPASKALAVLQARDILQARRKLGLSQAGLARMAGIRPETLNRIEQGRNKPTVATMGKIDMALEAVERELGNLVQKSLGQSYLR